MWSRSAWTRHSWVSWVDPSRPSRQPRRRGPSSAERFRLPASIGVGPNKLIAKMAAGSRKPRGLTLMDEQAFRNEFWPKEVQKLWGVGPQLATRMRSLGISTVGDLAHAPETVLKEAFGIIGPQLRDAAWGRDDTPLIPFYRGVDAKSMGHEVTLPEDCCDTRFLEGTLLRLSDQVSRRLRIEGYVSRVVAVKLRNHRFETLIRQRALGEFTDDHVLIYRVARGLLEANWKGERVRLLGPDGDERMQLLAGEPFAIALDVATEAPLAPPRVGWELHVRVNAMVGVRLGK